MAACRHALRLAYNCLSERLAPESYFVTIRNGNGEPTLTARTHYDVLRAIYTLDTGDIDSVSLDIGGETCPLNDVMNFAEGPLHEMAKSALGDDLNGAKWDRFLFELSDSLRNEALALAERERFHQTCRDLTGTGANLFTALTESVIPFDNGTGKDRFLLRLGSFSGHRTHPASKMKLRMGREGEREPLAAGEIRASTPEFGSSVDVLFLAVRRNCITAKVGRLRSLHQAGRNSYLSHFAQEFSDVFRAWFDALQATIGSEAAPQYVPFPVHPLQLDEIRSRFDGAVAARDILILPDVTLAMDPILSVRTLRPRTSARAPLVKTSLNILMTSVVRTLAPARAFNAPVLSDLLLQLVALTPAMGEILRIVPEPASLYWGRDPDPESAAYQDGYQLAAVLKGNPAQIMRKGEIAVPLNTLFAASPISGKPVILDIMRHTGVKDGTDALDYFTAYACLVLRADLGMLARYGVSLESHQQNLDMAFGKDGRPRAAIYRDINGGIEIFEPLLRANGFDIREQIHPVRRGVHDTLNIPLRQTVHTTFLSHLVPFTFIVAEGFKIPEKDLLTKLRKLVTDLLDHILMRHAPVITGIGGRDGRALFEQSLGKIRRGLLDDPWEVKCLLRMRALQTQSTIYRPIENPLAML